eukprot:GHRR01023769.1.p1 GENE.GHRR01023769.1~~GHRR01023769.1.p1  ORF type:complete len:393 (+),score=95.81 GHRR01023769.1:919-2097(+)
MYCCNRHSRAWSSRRSMRPSQQEPVLLPRRKQRRASGPRRLCGLSKGLWLVTSLVRFTFISWLLPIVAITGLHLSNGRWSPPNFGASTGPRLPAMWQLLSQQSQSQWTFWNTVRTLATVAQQVVSAEAAQHVAQHGRGLVRLPADMVQTLDGYFKGAGLTGKAAKLKSQALTDRLKTLARSQARGGLQPYRTPAAVSVGGAAAAVKQQHAMTPEQLQEQAEMETELEQVAAQMGPEVLAKYKRRRAQAAALAAVPMSTTRSGRLKATAKAALLEHMEQGGLLGLPHAHVRAALDLPPSSTITSPDRNLALKKVTPNYSEAEALTYALSRLPGCYAATSRIFKELSLRLPEYRPQCMLDFGAGPGTATWAAQEVGCSASFCHLTIVMYLDTKS